MIAAIALPLAHLTLSVLFHSLPFLSLPTSFFLITWLLFTLTSLLLAWFSPPSLNFILFLFALYERDNEFQM